MNNRSEGLDLLKLICAFLVVCIHIQFPKPMGYDVKLIARVAVPIFFMVTGYFLLAPAKDGKSFEVRKSGRSIVKLLKLIALSNLLYFAIYLLRASAEGKVQGYLGKLLSLDTLKKAVIYSQSPFCTHLWYLNAVLAAMLVILLVDRLRGRRLLYWLIPVLIAGDMALGKYSILIFGRYFPIIYTRNWLFFALPNMCLGMLFRERGLADWARGRRPLLAVLSLLFIAGSVGENRLLQGVVEKSVRENYFCTVFASVALFLLFASLDRFAARPLQALARLGRDTNTGIYIIHYVFVLYLPEIFKVLGLSGVFRSARPAFVFLASLIVVALYARARQRIRSRAAGRG